MTSRITGGLRMDGARSNDYDPECYRNIKYSHSLW